jgi:hypothetical protein
VDRLGRVPHDPSIAAYDSSASLGAQTLVHSRLWSLANEKFSPRSVGMTKNVTDMGTSENLLR